MQGCIKKTARLSLLTIFIIFLLPGYCGAVLTTLQLSEWVPQKCRIPTSPAWLGDFGRSRESFQEKYGTRFAFVFNDVQQEVLRGSGNTRNLWYWNLGVSQRLWKGSQVIAEFETDKNRGIDKDIPVYSLFDNYSRKNAGVYIPRLFLEQKLLQDKIFLAAGKLDLSDWFDANNLAGSADIQFLSSGLVNNGTIPFPDLGIGAMARFAPDDKFYFQTGAATAKAVSTKTGLSNAFNSTLFINEFGVSLRLGNLCGNYRFIPYLLHKKTALIADSAQDKTNQFGFALSFDQQISRRITLFLRYGFADPRVNNVQYTWSCGGQLDEPIAGRKGDYCAFAVLQNIQSRDFRRQNNYNAASSRETIIETYYSFMVNDLFRVSPDLQVVIDPRANKNVANVIVASLRFLVNF